LNSQYFGKPKEKKKDSETKDNHKNHWMGSSPPVIFMVMPQETLTMRRRTRYLKKAGGWSPPYNRRVGLMTPTATP